MGSPKTWILLLRAVNLGPTNKLPMKELRALLEDLGHTEVRTVLNSGNATFTSSRTSAKELAAEIEAALGARLGLSVRACVRTQGQIAAALADVPDVPVYLTVGVLFDKPKPVALKAFLATDWSPEVVSGNEQVLYLAFQNAAKTKLTNVKIEKALGVSCTARTPATLQKLIA